MADAAGAGRGVVELVRVGFDVRHELRERFGRYRGMDTQHKRVGGNHRDRGKVAQAVVIDLLHQRHDQQIGCGANEPGIAIGRSPGDEFGGNGTAGTDPVLHHEGLAKTAAQAFGCDTRQGVGVTTGGEGHHQPHWFVRPAAGALGQGRRSGD